MSSTQTDELREKVARIVAGDWAFCSDLLKEEYRSKADRILALLAQQEPHATETERSREEEEE